MLYPCSKCDKFLPAKKIVQILSDWRLILVCQKCNTQMEIVADVRERLKVLNENSVLNLRIERTKDKSWELRDDVSGAMRAAGTIEIVLDYVQWIGVKALLDRRIEQRAAVKRRSATASTFWPLFGIDRIIKKWSKK